ncbi:hypothetical protein TNCV_701671 [Trichonephila clavipes]|nr:hypothetical protein TNCV_701671 [Trichonephila clavipes]
MADSANDLQDMMSATAQELRALCLRLNPRKCASLHLSGRAPTGARPTKFFIEDSENFADANAALSILEKLSATQLAQWQKIDAIKTFFPTLSFSMRTAQLRKMDWVSE